MKLLAVGHSERYAIEQLQLSMFPNEKTEYTEDAFSGEDGAISCLSRGEAYLMASTTITLKGKTVTGKKRILLSRETVQTRRRLLQQSYYIAAVQLLEQPPEWGALSGVRPTKLTTRALLQGHTEKQAFNTMRQKYYVSEERAALSVECSRATIDTVNRLRPGDLSLYVGIPFCPTRCAYCSFVSNSIEKSAGLMEPFLDALEQEIRATAGLLKKAGLHIRSVYFGGGTPTTLSTEQLSRLMELLREQFDLSELLEYTVEGGRPDTLDHEKLRTIRALGCTRMSINPQTMNDEVLKLVRRNHTSADILRAYREACEAGFADINMDLIAGLPGDDYESFRKTLDTLIRERPSNITVHTLAIKKGAGLFENRIPLPPPETVKAMLDYSRSSLRAAGYLPYYLYRQKYMTGSFENIGWTLPGHESPYNIIMMEELHPVLALGGGGMNKVNLPGGRLERLHNPKYPKEYIEKIDDTIRQKEQFFRMLETWDSDIGGT